MIEAIFLLVKPQLNEEGAEDLANITIEEDKDALNEFLGDEPGDSAQTGMYTTSICQLLLCQQPLDKIHPV